MVSGHMPGGLPDRRLSAPSRALSIVLQELWPLQMHPVFRPADGTGYLARSGYSLPAYQTEVLKMTAAGLLAIASLAIPSSD